MCAVNAKSDSVCSTLSTDVDAPPSSQRRCLWRFSRWMKAWGVMKEVAYLLRCRARRFSRSLKAWGVMKEMVFLDSVRSTSRVMFAKSFLFTLHNIREQKEILLLLLRCVVGSSQGHLVRARQHC